MPFGSTLSWCKWPFLPLAPGVSGGAGPGAAPRRCAGAARCPRLPPGAATRHRGAGTARTPLPGHARLCLSGAAGSVLVLGTAPRALPCPAVPVPSPRSCSAGRAPRCLGGGRASPSLPGTGVGTAEPGRCYLKSLFCLCMEKYYLL